MSRPFLPIVPGLLLAACANVDLPEGSGQGLVTWDREPPGGAETWPMPEWKAGDRFLYLRGNRVRLALRAEEPAEGDPAGARWMLVDEESGIRVGYDGELAELGQHKPQTPLATRVLDPADSQYSWPLWVGKRWTCEFVNKAPGDDALPLIVTYHCDARETVTTPAGSFDCLRIWRRAHIDLPGDFFERVTVIWYAPQVGAVVKRLDDSILLELVEYQRQ